jgi:hypothetical protein
MLEEPVKNLLPNLGTRREYFDYLDRWIVGTVDDLRAHMTTRALVKASLLETSRYNGSRDAIAALGSTQQTTSRIDDTLFRVRWRGENMDWALVEVEDERYPILYTALETKIASQRVDQLVHSSPLLDKAWFAAPMFRRLWKLVLDAYPSQRFSKIVFEHESIFEVFKDDLAVDSDSEEEEEEIEEEEVEEEEEVISPERRRARMQITERIGKLDKALQKMRPEYEPLESIVSMRVPAPRRGGHDIYFDGRFTNRSDSITALRQTIEVVKNIYRYSTEMAEDASWPRAVDTPYASKPISLGMPLLIKFSQELDLDTFERWIASLRRKNNRFRLWGNPINRGPGKVHIYAIDNHLWQPVDLEVARDHLYALLPSGTCGNTIHRLIANTQRFIDPKLETYIGDKKYEDFIDKAPLDATNGGASDA